jgi:hypothetical protein
MRSVSLSTKFVFLLVLCSFAYFVEAQTTTPRETLEAQQTERRENFEANQEARKEEFASTSAARQEKLEERKENIASTTAARQKVQEERRAALSERVQERITNLAANVSNRIEAAIRRMENVIGRIESRTEKLSERGVDTTVAEGHIRDAKQTLEEAKSLIADIDRAVANVTGSENPREAWAETKTIFVDAKAALLSVHESLRAAIDALKTAVSEAELGQGNSAAVSDEKTNETSENDAPVTDVE